MSPLLQHYLNQLRKALRSFTLSFWRYDDDVLASDFLNEHHARLCSLLDIFGE
jgi:hypothetical protein